MCQPARDLGQDLGSFLTSYGVIPGELGPSGQRGKGEAPSAGRWGALSGGGSATPLIPSRLSLAHASPVADPPPSTPDRKSRYAGAAPSTECERVGDVCSPGDQALRAPPEGTGRVGHSPLTSFPTRAEALRERTDGSDEL